ncbi:MAG TPA: SH3 domain-containing protein [bacterium]|nr:SH3 domain-containing protein [bacterium]
MKKSLLAAALAVGFLSSAWLPAQPPSPLSGTYQKLTLGVDPSQGRVTGYYKEIDEPPNLPHSECVFYFTGQGQGDQYAIQAWEPGNDKSEATSGELTIFSAEKGRPSVQLKLEKLSRDCTALNPKLGKPEGALLDKSKAGAWTEVRVVGNPKSSYHQTPDLASPERGSAKRGTVLVVTGRQPGWAQVQAEQKSKGWIQENDLYPLSPGAPMPEPSKTIVPAAAPKIEPKPQAKPEPPAASVSAAKPDSKAELLQRLKALNVQAFGLALRVLANPVERGNLAASGSALEQELNELVAGLNRTDPSAYRSESTRIYETYLDLQYVRQDQPVVSLRLREETLKKSR